MGGRGSQKVGKPWYRSCVMMIKLHAPPLTTKYMLELSSIITVGPVDMSDIYVTVAQIICYPIPIISKGTSMSQGIHWDTGKTMLQNIMKVMRKKD